MFLVFVMLRPGWKVVRAATFSERVMSSLDCSQEVHSAIPEDPTCHQDPPECQEKIHHRLRILPSYWSKPTKKEGEIDDDLS